MIKIYRKCTTAETEGISIVNGVEDGGRESVVYPWITVCLGKG